MAPSRLTTEKASSDIGPDTGRGRKRSATDASFLRVSAIGRYLQTRPIQCRTSQLPECSGSARPQSDVLYRFVQDETSKSGDVT